METMGLALQARKQAIAKFFDSPSIQEKLHAFFSGDEKGVQKFRSTMGMLAMDSDFAKWKPESVLAAGIQAAQIGLSPTRS